MQYYRLFSVSVLPFSQHPNTTFKKEKKFSNKHLISKKPTQQNKLVINDEQIWQNSLLPNSRLYFQILLTNLALPLLFLSLLFFSPANATEGEREKKGNEMREKKGKGGMVKTCAAWCFLIGSNTVPLASLSLSHTERDWPSDWAYGSQFWVVHSSASFVTHKIKIKYKAIKDIVI